MPFNEKKQKIEELDSKVVTLYLDVKSCNEWNAEMIENRANRLADINLLLFAVEEPTMRISFADPRYQEYTCDVPDDATFKTPNYYVLQGERVVVSNFAEMLRLIIGRLYEQDNRIIERMARNEEHLLSWSQTIMFSYDSEKVTGEYKWRVRGTDIFHSVGFSAAHIMYIIGALLDKYEIDRADFVYSAKSYKTTGAGLKSES